MVLGALEMVGGRVEALEETAGMLVGGGDWSAGGSAENN
jgi:hypothetical protein